MADEDPPHKCPPEGLPAWMGTFADLMSLLMCFFVLLLSFATMDINKFKKLSESLQEAFGVQSDIPALEIPKGTSVVAHQFSPGKPIPTLEETIRQKTIDDDQQTLDFDQSKVASDADEVREQLKKEIAEGKVKVSTIGPIIIIRIEDRASFASGAADMNRAFSQTLKKIRKILVRQTDKIIVIAGHTDDVPIRTARYRSNWELSAARSVTVAHELLKDKGIESQRIRVEGYADSSPLAPNDSKKNRSRNRRVEITLIPQSLYEKKNDQLINPD